MHDIKSIREDADAFDAALARRGLAPLASGLLALDADRRARQTAFQDAQTKRVELSRQIGVIKKQGGDPSQLMAEVALLKETTQEAEREEAMAQRALTNMLEMIPNLPAADVPDGKDENDNVEIRRIGVPKNFAFKPKEHDEIGAKLGMMDFETAARMSGARFVVLKDKLARLQRALGAFMLDIQTGEHGYVEMDPPVLVRPEALYGTGQLPKFAEDLFLANSGHYLIPTAEVPLTNVVAGQLLDEADLPKRMTALTYCFRSEAGAAGKDTRGMIRQHQFMKVELVSIVHPDRSEDEHQRMTKCAETILQRLDLPYRVITLCVGDMGFGAQKTYDIEVWLPGQDAYREISSCSNCGDFQARRMDARFRPAEGKGTRYVHTLNGSGLAVGRTMVALLENYQNQDGSVTIPEALRPYMGGLERIVAP